MKGWILIAVVFLAANAFGQSAAIPPYAFKNLNQTNVVRPSYLYTQPKVQWKAQPILTPRGAVFCRMEDYLTRKTKVWMKVGVK